MTNFTIILLAVVVAIVALIVFLYLHKHHREYHITDIEAAVRRAYKDGATSLPKDELNRAMKRHFHCSTKEAHYIIGVARRNGLVDIKEGHIDLLR